MRSRRLALEFEGVVQGVGFRPFVYRAAREAGLVGFVCNDRHGVRVEAQGGSEKLASFVDHVRAGPLAAATVTRCSIHDLEPRPARGLEQAFTIRSSAAGPGAGAPIGPDLATCPDCLAELRDPKSRRYRYPFLNCTVCGPRFSILLGLPYDRPRTTMARFEMCATCRAEYEDPNDRRFHAQPTACPACGPQLAFWQAGELLGEAEDALLLGLETLRRGRILGVKGIGGYHLCVAAGDQVAVERLRRRKQRPDKPFAVMFAGLAEVETVVEVTPAGRALLSSSAAPIVILPRRAPSARHRAASGVAEAVGPGNPNLGCLLAYSPLHHLLLAELGGPLVATSGNRSGEPVVVDDQEAFERLGSIADAFLCHDRPIARPVEDSVLRVVDERPLFLRRSRGYAPLTLAVPTTGTAAERTVMALGGHQKNTLAYLASGQLQLSQHIGDLGGRRGAGALVARETRDQVQRDLAALFELRPDLVAADAHPDYGSTRAAEDWSVRTGRPLVRVPHHLAHVLAGLVDHGLSLAAAGPLLGVAWDGAGLGPHDSAEPVASIWGGEWLELDTRGWCRSARLEPFPLPGGEVCMQEPRRSALGLLVRVLGPDWPATPEAAPLFDHAGAWGAAGPLIASFADGEAELLTRLVASSRWTPWTSSVGRLFDAVAALLGLVACASFEGQAAMALEALASSDRSGGAAAPFDHVWRAHGKAPRELQLEPFLFGVLAGLARGVPRARIAARFHATLVAALVDAAVVSQRPTVVLSGGCFQNTRLLAGAERALGAAGFCVLGPRRLPPGDGALAAGQALFAALAPPLRHLDPGAD